MCELAKNIFLGSLICTAGAFFLVAMPLRLLLLASDPYRKKGEGTLYLFYTICFILLGLFALYMTNR